jgi:type II secretory pathway component PulJ
MKKHNDGYALPFVLVVMVVVCLIAVSVMSFSLRCLQSQQASIARMTDKYKAMGRLEIVISQLERAEAGNTVLLEIKDSDAGFLFVYDDSNRCFTIAAKENETIVGYKITVDASVSLQTNNDKDFYAVTNLKSLSYAPLDTTDLNWEVAE